MANNSPTIVAASLSDDQLKKSIDSLVTHVDEAMKKMVQSTNNAVGEMEAKLKSLGNLKIDSGVSADGGASKRTKAQNAETDAIEKNIAARDKQIKKNQDAIISFDQMAKAQQVAIRSANPSDIRNADTLQTMNIQLDLLRERLREARQQYSSFVALAAHATTTGDKGLFQYATDGVHRYEQEVRNLIPQIRTLQSGIQQMGDVIAPQGHTIQNYVNSLQKANPELAALNAQYKSGTSLLQDQSTSYASATQSAQRYTEEIRKQAQAIRESQQWKEKGFVTVGNDVFYDPTRSKAQTLSLEEQMLNAENRRIEAQEKLNAESQKEVEIKSQLPKQGYLFDGNTRDESLRQQQSRAALERYKQTKQEEQNINSLNAAIMRSLHIGKDEIKTYDTRTASAKELNAMLKQQKDAYANLTMVQRHQRGGVELADSIQKAERALQKLQAMQSRPINLKSVMGLDERTLDDIAYKMRQLSAYRSGLDVSKQSKEITQVNDEYNRLKKRMDEVMQKNQQMIASNTALGRSWNYMKNRLAFYFTVGASTQFVKNLIEVRSQYEMNERALGILVNSAERGTQIFNELSQMALVSPYTLIELSAAAKQLTAYDVAAKDVVDTTRRLADMAAAVGIPIERLTYALGQIKAYGYLNARDARMFANAGIPLVKQLSEYYTELEGRLVSTADIYDRIKKKSIGYEEVTSVIAKMTDEGGKFYDFQAKMAETLKVQLANLTLAWNNMLNAMGEESQGVLVAGIGTLKQVFLHWKDIEHVLYELVVALGAYKAYQIITTRLMGATAASLDAQVLAMKRNKAAMLEKQSLTQKLTYDEAKLIATQNQVTAADYRNALSGKQLTKQKALLLVALNKNNAQLKAAVVNMGLLTTQEVANITTGKALAIVFKSIGISIRNAALAIKAFAASMWPLLVVGAIYELYHAWDSYGEHIKEVNKQAAEHAKEAFDNIKQYLESESTINTRQRVVYKEGNPLTDAESQKAWDEMREKIELSSSASNTFVAKLMQINDINSRLAAGFDYLRDVQRVAGVMQTLEEDAVNISSTVLGGLFGEGLKDDLQDFLESKDVVISAYGDMGKAAEELKKQQESANVGIGSILYNMQEFAKEVKKTTDSIYDIASKEGFNTNEQREFFEREISEIAQAEEMGAKETRIFRMQAEKEYYAYARAQLVSQLEYQQGAQKAATEKRIKDLDNEFGANKALQESFFTWLTEKQDHAVKNMLRGKTQEEIKQGEWLKGSNAKWVEEMARKFSKEYGVSFDDLHRLVLNANTWSINIPVFFQTIGQPLSDVQRDYEARTGKKFSSNPLIKDAKTQVDILDTLKKKQKEVANEMETARKAGGKYWEDNKQRYKEENDALVADIHAYNALTDAEEKANKKGGKGSKKDPLLDALKQEISLVEKLQSDYDKLSKSGASQADALDTIRGAYGKTIRLLNVQLGKYGLPQLDISQLITGKDPNKALAHFKQTLDTLVRKGMLTMERSKELEAVVEKFTLSAKTYNLDMITKGLNNELGKLKDEYELAIAFDADPEIGNVFADLMGIDTDALPHTVHEYASRMTSLINKYLSDKNVGIELPNISLTNNDMRDLQHMVDSEKLSVEAFDIIKRAVEEVRSLKKKDFEETQKEWNTLISKYGNLQDKLGQIYKEALKQQINVAKKFGTTEQQNELVKIQSKVALADTPEDFAYLQSEAAKIVKTIVENNPVALKVYLSTENEKDKNVSKAIWEDFKNTDLYTMTFEDMANNSTKAIQLIIDKLNLLKNSVKEDPASMKALMKSLEDAEKEMATRAPFAGISNSIMDIADAAKEAEDAQKALLAAEKETQMAQQKVDESEDLSPQEQAEAREKLTSAIEKQKKAEENLVGAQNKGKKSQERLKASLQGLAGQLGNIKGLFDTVSELLSFAGDDEAAKAVDAISEGFSIMTTVIMGVVAAMELLKASQPWLLAIAAALAVVVGLVKFLSGSDNEAIDKKIKDSENAVKALQIAYVGLEHEIEKAYGTQDIGSKKVLKTMKEAELYELRRQLRLEQSRDSKDRDEGRILDLAKQIKELENEIGDMIDDIVNDLLGISSVGDAMETLMDGFIEALRNGEDAMAVFDESVDDMIVNMVKKMYTTKILQPWFDDVWNQIQSDIDKRGEELMATDVLNIDKSAKAYQNLSVKDFLASSKAALEKAKAGEYSRFEDRYKAFEGESVEVSRETWIAQTEEIIKTLEEAYGSAVQVTEDDIRKYATALRDGRPEIEGSMDAVENFLRELGLMKDTLKDKNLSLLQQGIQSITEDTAGALEGITNGISQQCYLQSDLLTQIRDAVVGIDIDVQVATQAQMLLQLQQSYAVQMAIQGILEGVLVPSGRAFSVELLS